MGFCVRNGSCRLRPGDIVTRFGSDEQIVLSIDHSSGTLEVECIKVGDLGFFRVGEREKNLISRFTFVRRPGPFGSSDAFEAEFSAAEELVSLR